jgi:ppGpp synthetase/RelA/SpoT-type nucleotidyltranferase
MAASEQIAPADLDQFQGVSAICQETANRVAAHLADLGYSAVPRAKTSGTLVDKLRRQHTRLSQVQDLAGTRFVVSDRIAQDRAVAAVTGMYQTLGCTFKVDDLRDDPSYGYRAVHVIVIVDQVPVEIQIRTELQDLWAQVVEKLGDKWGRGLRYGQDPDQPDARIQGSVSRREVIQLLGRLSEVMNRVEALRVQVVEVSAESKVFDEYLAAIQPANADSPAGDLDFDPMLGTLESSGLIPSQELQTLRAGWRDMTVAELLGVVRALLGGAAERMDSRMRETELELRTALGRLVAAV